ncbi:MAG TPA: lysophospholipid acyltransferase family protein [Bacilli bacterium]|nr:lysophospholipid acyltransferase family protein [Bacilli bacterium]
MFKYTKWVLRLIFPLLGAYFIWMIRYARKPEKYPLELRYGRTRKFILKLAKVLDLEITINNQPKFNKDEKYYIVANHNSLVDAVVAVYLFEEPVTFIVKKEASKTPFVRLFIKIIGGVYIERDNLRQEIQAMQKTRDSLAAQEVSWMVFPEGTRNRDYHAPVAPYKAGAFKAPLQTDTTIVPLVMWGTQLVLPLKTRAKKFPILVEFLPPVTKSEMAGLNTQQIAMAVEEATNKKREQLKVEYLKLAQLNKHGRAIINKQTGKEE